MKAKNAFFQEKLLEWYHPSDRPLPWKAIKNPYYIWLSEIILQQTRVEQGLPYYERFVAKYPTVVDLANAPQDEVYKLWEGLGYYSRARNLHAAAKMIVNDHQAVFPTTYKDIRALKGVGEYTAAAIASFAYDLPYAVVDGNVYRVLSRFFGIETAIDSTTGKKEFRQLADQLLDKNNPAQYNQAIMDFGATHCKPKKPLCETCLHQSECTAWKKQLVNVLPLKAKKIKKRKRYFYYFIMEDADTVLLQKRGSKDIWGDLYEFPMIELNALVEGLFLEERLRAALQEQKWFEDSDVVFENVSSVYKQTLSHQQIHALFIKTAQPKDFFREKNNSIRIERKKIKNFAFPRIITNYLEKKGI